VTVRIEPWSDDDFALLALQNTPEMTDHLGGPEPEDKLTVRHAHYLDGWRTGAAAMFTVKTDDAVEPVGSVGYWKREWRGEPAYESGWAILPQYQGRGFAAAAVRLALEHARTHGDRAKVYAFPPPENPASNAVCRKAGFVFLGETDFEYPKGNHVITNEWVATL
jgi:RimJ/RimL family protein N-acetyltransferase